MTPITSAPSTAPVSTLGTAPELDPAAPAAYFVTETHERELLLASSQERTVPGEAHPIRELTFEPTDGHPLVPFASGAHVAIRHTDERGVERRNAYSLINDGVSPRTYVIAVRRAGNDGFSDWLHDVAQPGDRFTAAAPSSAFRLDPRARHHLLIGAGIGLTPILAHARACARWGMSCTVVLGWRGASNVPYLEELREIANGDLHLAGNRDELAAVVREQLETAELGTFAYACGPEEFLQRYAEIGAEVGWNPERLRREYFALTPPDPGEPFEATVEPAGVRLSVPSGTSLLEALEAAEIAPPSLCRQGVCGQCVMRVRGGDVTHRDVILTPEARERSEEMYVCVSRGRGDGLVIEHP